MLARSIALLAAMTWCELSSAFAQQDSVESASSPGKDAVGALIPWTLREKSNLTGIPFKDVIFDTTGKRVLPFDPMNEVDRRVALELRAVLNEVMKRVNGPDSITRRIFRINEVSSHFEDLIRELLNGRPGLACDFPRTAEGQVQRAGYPDLRLVDKESQRVYYIDPKLYAVGNRDSTFRTFYFEPRSTTNKVLDDAVHLVVGFEHAKSENHNWSFTRWDLVDLSKFKVKLKAEFQGSNRDLYQPQTIVASSAK